MSKKRFISVVTKSVLALSFVAPSISAVTPIIVRAEEAEDTSSKYITFLDVVGFESEEANNLLTDLTIQLSEEQDLIIEGSLSSDYQLSMSFGEDATVINEDNEFSITVSSNLKDGLLISLESVESNEIIDQINIDLQTVVSTLTDSLGMEKLDKELEEAGEVDEESILEIPVEDGLDFEQSSAVELLLEGQAEELNEQAPANSISSFSTFSTTSSSRTHQNGVYTVVSGDNFNSIASSFNLSRKQLSTWNPHITNINILRAGDRLAVTRAGYETVTLTDAQRGALHKGNNPSPFANVHEFIDHLAPIAIEVSNEPGQEALYPSLMLAQAIHESGAARVTEGLSQLARPPYHNLSGIKARGSVPSVLMWTWEAVPDTYNETSESTIRVDIPQYFQTFPSYHAALQRYANLLRVGRGTGEDFYYRGTWRSNTRDVWEVLDQGGLRGYATDPRYFSAIMATIDRYDLTRFDNTARVSGQNRFETAAEISRQGWNSADTVFIADAFNYADALAGAPLATNMNAPILLSRQGKLDETTANEIKRLGAKNAVVLGGEVALSNQVINDLNNLGLTTRRIAGSNRYETAGLIANELVSRTKATEAIVVSGEDFADAMSVAPFAAKKGIPIYLTRSRSLSTEVREASNSIKDWTIVGGSVAITGATGRQLQNNVDAIRRIQGANRYATNQRVIEHYGSPSNEVFVATGQDFADALTGSVLAGKNGNSILLVRNSDSILSSQMRFADRHNFTVFTMIGGEVALPNRIGESLRLNRLVQ